MNFRIFMLIHGGGTKGFSSSSFSSRDPLQKQIGVRKDRDTSGGMGEQGAAVAAPGFSGMDGKKPYGDTAHPCLTPHCSAPRRLCKSLLDEGKGLSNLATSVTGWPTRCSWESMQAMHECSSLPPLHVPSN